MAVSVAAPARPGFSPSDVALEGFRVLRDHWRVVVGWSIFNVVALVALSILAMVITFGAAVAASAGAQGSASALAFSGFLVSLGEAFTTAIIAGGVFRLMLRPQEPGLLHLRVGAGELRILGVWIVRSVATFLLLGVCAVLVVGGRSIGPAAAIGAWLLVAGVGVWLGLRFSLSAVASLAEGRFAFEQSWRLTRGRSWSLLGVVVLSVSVTALIGMLVAIAVFLVMSAGVGFGAMFEATFGGEDGLRDHPLVYVAEVGVELVMFPAFLVLTLAPWVSAYQVLDDGADRALSAPAHTV